MAKPCKQKLMLSPVRVIGLKCGEFPSFKTKYFPYSL